MQKLDPYINVDPGTLNPYEHGECYVTEDGAECGECGENGFDEICPKPLTKTDIYRLVNRFFQ